MSKSKFSNCFIDQSEMYHYDIEWEGQVIAKAHTLSAKDKSKIEYQSMTKRFKNGELEFDVDSQKLRIATILSALDWWDADRPLNEDNVSMLPEGMINYIYDAITAHEEKVQKIADDTEKN